MVQLNGLPEAALLDNCHFYGKQRGRVAIDAQIGDAPSTFASISLQLRHVSVRNASFRNMAPKKCQGATCRRCRVHGPIGKRGPDAARPPDRTAGWEQRPDTEAMDEPRRKRKRVTIACELCRKGKRKVSWIRVSGHAAGHGVLLEWVDAGQWLLTMALPFPCSFFLSYTLTKNSNSVRWAEADMLAVRRSRKTVRICDASATEAVLEPAITDESYA